MIPPGMQGAEAMAQETAGQAQLLAARYGHLPHRAGADL